MEKENMIKVVEKNVYLFIKIKKGNKEKWICWNGLKFFCLSKPKLKKTYKKFNIYLMEFKLNVMVSRYLFVYQNKPRRCLFRNGNFRLFLRAKAKKANPSWTLWPRPRGKKTEISFRNNENSSLKFFSSSMRKK